MSAPDTSITSAQHYIDFLLARKSPHELPDIPNRCIINYVPDVNDTMKSLFPHRSVTLGITNPMQLDVFSPDDGISFAMSHGLHGSPMAAVQLEELIALGCENFLVIGPAGHPTSKRKPELELGELLLPTNAWIFEGTSPHYGKHKQSAPSADAVKRLKNTLQDLGLQYSQGAVATTDALYRETEPFLQKLLEKQVLAIEMELSALFSVAHFHSKAIAGLVFISDLVSTDGNWKIAPSPRVYRNVVQLLTDTIITYTKHE